MIRSYFSNKYSIFFILLFCFQLNARQNFFSHLYEWLVPQQFYSRYKLYDILDRQVSISDRQSCSHLAEHDDYYLDIIEQSILKREYNGSKNGHAAQIKKCAWAGAELGLAGLCALGADSLSRQGNDAWFPTFLVAAALSVDGLHKFYKGIIYKSRMKKKMERDKLVRRRLREIASLI